MNKKIKNLLENMFLLMPFPETFYNSDSVDALAYMGIGGAALIEQAKTVSYVQQEAETVAHKRQSNIS